MTRTSKYRSEKTIWEGIVFDSKKEAQRFRELWLLQKAGEITNLQRQVRFQLIPSQRVNGELVERAVTYVADFTYNEGDKYIVEDCKGVRTDVYKLKRKLMLYVHGIRVRET